MPNTRNRVPAQTSEEINQRIQRETEQRLEYYDKHRDEIPQRLRALNEEWDIERAIEANASALAFAGIALGATKDKRWLTLPALVTGFLFSTRCRDGARQCRF